MIEKKTLPKILQALPKEKAASFNSNIVVIKAIVNTELAKDVYKTKIKRYEEKLFECNDKYSQACVTIQLNYENGLCVYIKDVKSLYEIWLIFKN